MYLSELFYQPLADLGWVNKFTLLCKLEDVSTKIPNVALSKEAGESFSELFKAVGVPDVVYFGFLDYDGSIAQQLFIDVHGTGGTKKYGRLVFTNTIQGISVRYWPLDDWDSLVTSQSGR